jgi:hypothetical protein
MQGQSESLSETEAVRGGYEYKLLSDAILPLKNPVGEDITYEETAGVRFDRGIDQRAWLTRHVAGSACYGHTNLVPEFCRAYLQASGREALAVHVAKGSTVIADWLPGTPGYEILLRKAGSAIKKCAACERIFFVWLQGESDAIYRTDKATYKQRLTALCHALKRDLGIERFGIIRVGRFTNDARDLEIIAAQDELCAENPDFLMLTTLATTLNTQAEAMNPQVGGHYSARGLELLGKAAGTTLGQL